MKNIIETITNAGTTFASFVYTNKISKKGEIPETARYTLILGGKYINLLEKSKLELELLIPTFQGDMLTAANEVMASLNKSIEAHKNGTQSADYTKKGMYSPIGNGVNINDNDNSIQVFGLLHSKVVIKEGFRKPVNSAPMTILKNKIRKMLPIAGFREFAFDVGNIQTVKVNGDTLEVVTSYNFEPETSSELATA
jgi:hypothetical protein